LFVAVVLLLAVVVCRIPRSYEVVGKLVVTHTRADLLVTPSDPIKPNLGVTLPTLQDMAVHAELLKNRSLVEAVVQTIGPDRVAPGAPASAAGVDRATDVVQEGLTVQVVPNSNLILVRYRGRDAVSGAAIVNALLEQYRDANVRMHATPGVARMFAAQRDEMAGRVRTSERALTAFEHETALLASAEQVDAYARRLAAAEYEAIDAEHDLEEAEGRVRLLKDLLDREPETIQVSSTTRRNPNIRLLEERLEALEMDKAHLLTLYTADDRRVQDKQTEIGAERQRLAEARATEMVPGSEVTHLNSRHRDLEMQYIAATLAAEKDRIRIEAARAIAVEMRDHVRAVALGDVRRQSLIREVQASADAYLLYRKKAEEGRVTAALDDREIINVAIGERASPQGTPVGLPRGLALGLAVAIAMVFAVGGAFLVEYFARPAR
jgi:uncharacterized protein involved in exopolysaccharide biosynthesis